MMDDVPGGDKNHPQETASSGPSDAGDVADRLNKLHSLKKQGLITEQEYETKKKQLLDTHGAVPDTPILTSLKPDTQKWVTTVNRKMIISVAVAIIGIVAVLSIILLFNLLPAAGEGQATQTATIPYTPSPQVQVPSPPTPVPTVTQSSFQTGAGPTIPPSSTMKTITTISGQYAQTTGDIYVPYGYWEMWYTADPFITGGQEQTSGTGSVSALFPSLSIQVMKSDQPAEAVRVVEPPGGLDITLWKRSGDPRPWVEKFYEGNKEYYFIIRPRHLYSYTIEIRVPGTT